MISHQDDFPECPLCMEAFELDDLNFLPCTCRYQICRFCWHRIRTNETGLCPGCRKSYPEDPVQFKPLSEDEVHNIKKDRRQKEVSRRQKSSENRKHLTNVRVVQRNLVFVVGLSQRLADAEVLKRQEYFGKFGRIHKVVVNQSTSYVGSQGPSASAYVTYVRPEDAYHAILAVNNLHIDHRNLKASLGTTKYCSQFLKGALCSKADCMYLHDLGDEAASFSKEDIQQGKHLQYEQKLIKQYSNSVQAHQKTVNDSIGKSVEEGVGEIVDEVQDSNNNKHNNNNNNHNNHIRNSESSDNSNNTDLSENNNNIACNNVYNQDEDDDDDDDDDEDDDDDDSGGGGLDAPKGGEECLKDEEEVEEEEEEEEQKEEANEYSDNNTLNEDLGFDPWDISSKGLADLIETEKITSSLDHSLHLSDHPHPHPHDPLFNIFLSQHYPVSRNSYYSRDVPSGDFFKVSSTTTPLRCSHSEHFNMAPATSPTFPPIPASSNRWQNQHNLSWIQLHNNNNNVLPSHADFYTSSLTHNIASDPAIITAGILSEGGDSGLSQPFPNFNHNSRRHHQHLQRHNTQLHSPFSHDHRHSRLPPPGFSATPSAEHQQLPAL